MPFGGDGSRIEIVYVARFDPTVLTEGVVDAIFVVAISGGVGSHVCAKFEGIVSILEGLNIHWRGNGERNVFLVFIWRGIMCVCNKRGRNCYHDA